MSVTEALIIKVCKLPADTAFLTNTNIVSPRKAVSAGNLHTFIINTSITDNMTCNNNINEAVSNKYHNLNTIENDWNEDYDVESDENKVEESSPLSTDDVTHFLDVRSQRWIIFGRVWNEIICKLRDSDHLSDSEKENLLFSSFDWLKKPIYLPLFQTAGCIDT